MQEPGRTPFLKVGMGIAPHSQIRQPGMSVMLTTRAKGATFTTKQLQGPVTPIMGVEGLTQETWPKRAAGVVACTSRSMHM